MKNKEFHKLLKNNQLKPNSGFTLTELLVGLIMSVFVVGALGFGLMQILRTTRTETSKVAARNETSRALDFISDEVRRAGTIENNAANANGFALPAGADVVLALDIPEVNRSFGVDGDTATSERIVYYLAPVGATSWNGPRVLFRYGPPLDANGDYTAGAWTYDALVDGIDDTTIAASPCDAGDTLTPVLGTASGFHACIIGSNAAQLFLTGETDVADVGKDTYTADTRVVARARTAPADSTDTFVSYTMSFKTLGATYNCNPADSSTWSMRTDFGNNPSDANDTTTWIHQEDRQPQPIEIDTSNTLTITSVPVAPSNSDCLSKGDETATGDASTEPLSAYTDGTFPDGHTVPYEMRFVDPADSSTSNNWLTFNGNSGGHDNPDVNGDGTVLIFKNGSVINNASFPYLKLGYDYDNDGNGEQNNLGDFLVSQGYATETGTAPNKTYTIANLEADERIMAVEVGHTDQAQPGFDTQDSVFLLSSDVFAENY